MQCIGKGKFMQRVNIRSVSSIVAIFFIFTCGDFANAWTIEANYEGQQIGEQCEKWDAKVPTVSDVESFSGSKSCRISINAGSTGWDGWGGIFNHPKKLIKGDEVWVRIRIFMPVGFDYKVTGSGNRLKFVRLHTRNTQNSNFGYIDWLMIHSDYSNKPFGYIYEGEAKWSMYGESVDYPEIGKWESYEFYVKFDDITANNGGQARVRTWKNGKLLANITDRITLKTADAYSEATYFFTWWNAGSPKTQEMYIDDLIVTTERPAMVDEFGNPSISGGDVAPGEPDSVTVN